MQMHFIICNVFANAQVTFWSVCSVTHFVFSVLGLCTLTNLFTVQFMRLPSVHVYARCFTLTHPPIRSPHILPIRLMMGAQLTDPRLNPLPTVTDHNTLFKKVTQ